MIDLTGCTWWSWQEETIWRLLPFGKKSGRTVDGILLVGGNSSPQLLRVWTPECLGSSWGDGNSKSYFFIFIPKIWGRFSHFDDFFFSIGGGGCRWRKHQLEKILQQLRLVAYPRFTGLHPRWCMIFFQQYSEYRVWLFFHFLGGPGKERNNFRLVLGQSIVERCCCSQIGKRNH